MHTLSSLTNTNLTQTHVYTQKQKHTNKSSHTNTKHIYIQLHTEHCVKIKCHIYTHVNMQRYARYTLPNIRGHTHTHRNICIHIHTHTRLEQVDPPYFI